MKIISKLAFLLILLLAFAACEKEDDVFIDPTNKLIGSWLFVESSDSCVVYKRVHSLIDDEGGLTFKSQNKMINRANSGWCGTPPIAYTDYEGVWSEKDSIVSITVGYWGGKTSSQWKLISVDDEYLKYSLIMQTFEE